MKNRYLLIALGLILPTMIVPAEVKKKVAAWEKMGQNIEADEFLLASARMNDIGGIKVALKQGANVNAKTESGRTALQVAALKRNHDMIKLLLDRGADINLANDEGITPLIWAVYNRDARTAEILLNRGANVKLREKMHA